MMKGEYRDDHEDEDHISHHNNNNNNNNNSNTNITSSTPPIFSDDFHHHHHHHHRPKFLSPPPHHFLSPHHPYHHPQPPPQLPEPIKQTPPPPPLKKPKNTPTSSDDGGGGGTIELSRRPRGRPPGSKNKPKPPATVVLTRNPDANMSPYILELSGGADIVDSLTRFTRRRGHSLCVLNATGAVTNVTLKQSPIPPSTTAHGTVTFHGRFDVLSLAGVILITPLNRLSSELTISLGGPQGQIVGGKVAGRLTCSGTVYVVATSFDNPTYCRLPLEEAADGGDGGGGQSSSQDGGGGGIYSSSEVMWGNSSGGGNRAPQPNY